MKLDHILEAEIRRMTARNAHTEAYAIMAQLLDDKDAARFLSLVAEVADGVGYVPQPLVELRYHYCLKGLFDKARTVPLPSGNGTLYDLF